MKLNALTLALAATAFGTLSANAQTTVIEERRPPAVVIEQPAPPPAASVDVQKSEPILGGIKNTTIHSDNVNGAGCTTKTVNRQTLLGSETVRRSDCN